MNKNKWNHRIKTFFKLPNNSKIVYYRNPKEVRSICLEPINPTHKIIMWGNPKKKRTKNKIRIGRIIIPCALIITFNAYFNFLLSLVLSQILLSLCLSYFIYGIGVFGHKWFKVSYKKAKSVVIC